LKEVAEEDGISDIDSLREAVLCGANCRFCVPYIKRMLRTGETEFPWPDAEKQKSSTC
jgi:bacterioferritin-associated ferredoxin